MHCSMTASSRMAEQSTVTHEFASMEHWHALFHDSILANGRTVDCHTRIFIDGTLASTITVTCAAGWNRLSFVGHIHGVGNTCLLEIFVEFGTRRELHKTSTGIVILG